MLYRAILADPPWHYNGWQIDGVQARKRQSDRGMVIAHYPVMQTRDISNLPIKQLAAKDCVLFMWATWPNLEAAFEVGNAWGFKYATVAFVWAKTSRNRGNSFLTKDSGWHFGLGNWTRANTEPCLLFRRGKIHRLHPDVAQLIIAPVGKHSAKPLETYDRIERLVEGPYLELFARNKRPGWSAWGNEIESDITLESA